MKHTKLFLIAVFLVTFFSSCLKDDEIDRTPYGSLIYANAFTEAQSISYFFDGRYTNTQPYRGIEGSAVFTGSRYLVITDPITNATLLDTAVRFEAQQLYHSFFYGTRDEPKLLLAQFEAIENLETQSGVRFFHLANDTEAVTLQLVKDGEVIQEYTAREQETDTSVKTHKIYDPIETGNYTFRILNEDGDEIAKRENEVFIEQRYYTLTLIGTPDSDTHPLYIGLEWPQ